MRPCDSKDPGDKPLTAFRPERVIQGDSQRVPRLPISFNLVRQRKTSEDGVESVRCSLADLEHGLSWPSMAGQSKAAAMIDLCSWSRKHWPVAAIAGVSGM
jgi:hypothetical protein